MSLINNFYKLSSTFLITKFLIIFWNIYLANSFENDLLELGTYMFMISQFSVISILAEGSLSYTIQHFISSEKLSKENAISKYWFFSLFTRFLVGLICSIVLFIIIYVQFPDRVLDSLILSLTLLVFNVGAAPNAIFISYNNINPMVISNIINVTVSVIAAVLLNIYFQSITAILLAFLIGNTVHSIYLLFVGFKDFGLCTINSDFKNDFYKIFIKFSLPLVVASFCYTFFFRVDVNFLALFSTELITYLNYALILFFIFFDVIWSQFAVSFTPNLIREWNIDKKNRDKNIEKFLILFSFFSLIMVISILFLHSFGGFFIELLLGSNGGYYKIIPILNFLLLSFPFLLCYSLFYRVYLIKNSSFKFMFYSIVFLITKVIILTFFDESLIFKFSGLVSSILLILVSFLLVNFTKTLKVYRLKLNNYLIKSVIIFLALLVYLFDSDYMIINQFKIYIIFSILVISFIFFRDKISKSNFNKLFK